MVIFVIGATHLLSLSFRVLSITSTSLIADAFLRRASQIMWRKSAIFRFGVRWIPRLGPGYSGSDIVPDVERLTHDAILPKQTLGTSVASKTFGTNGAYPTY